MDAAEFQGAMVPRPFIQPATFTTTATAIYDAGPMRGFVGYHIVTALGTTTTLTPTGAPALNGNAADATPATSAQIGPIRDTTLTAISHAVTSTAVGWFPFDLVASHVIRYIKFDAADDLDGKGILLVSKPI